MKSFKQTCIALRKKDYTLNEIMRVTGRAKSSIYPHICDIPLSARKKLQIKKAAAEHIRTFPKMRKGKSVRPFKKFSHWTPETTLLVSHLLFDGEIGHTRCVYNNRSEALIERVEKLMRYIYAFEPRRSKNTEHVLRLSYYNVALSNYLKEKSILLLQNIHALSRECQREFLRAFFDDEGCIHFRRSDNHRRIRGYQNDKMILKTVKEILNNFNIAAKLHEPNEVVITGKDNLIKFQKEINFSSGVRVNGKRSNSIWKESLEKREILAKAIASFKS